MPTTEHTTKVVVHGIPRLPPELWLLIFRFATSAPIIYSEYEPFQTGYHDTTITSSTSTALSDADAALRDKCAIALVCRQWRALAGDMRYEDIRIGHGIAALHAALSKPAAIVDGGTIALEARYRVRRAVLPYAHTATPTYHAPPALALLALLPHLEVLVRPPPPPRHRSPVLIAPHTAPFSRPSSPTLFPRFEFPTAAPALPALRRLEWAFDKTGAAARAGGINTLTDVLIASSRTLHELILTGPMPLAALRQQHCVRLGALRTLRLHAGAGACPFVARQMTYWALPALENVVVGGAARAEALEALWKKFGGQVRVLELELGRGRGAGADGVSMGDAGKIIQVCPALEELNLRMGVADLWNSTVDSDDGTTQTWACTHSTLQRVGICVDAGEWSVKTWTTVVEYVGKLAKGCPGLHLVVLYVQDVEVAIRNSQFHALRETLSSSGRQLFLRSVHV